MDDPPVVGVVQGAQSKNKSTARALDDPGWPPQFWRPSHTSPIYAWMEMVCWYSLNNLAAKEAELWLAQAKES